MSDDVKTAVGGVMTAFEEFKSTNDARLKEIEKRGAATAETEAKLARIEADIAKHEGVSAKLLAAETEAKAAKAAADEAKAALDKVEAKLARVGTSRTAADPTELKARMNTFARAVAAVGRDQLSEEQVKVLAEVRAETKSLSLADDTSGGYLAPSEYVREIIKAVTLMSPVRQLASVRTTGAKSILLPKRTGQFAATRVGEQGTRSETTGQAYGMVEITAPEMYALVDISQQNLEDSAFDLEAEISMEATDQFAVKEGAEFVSGTGVNQLEGIVTAATAGTVSNTVSGTATTIADANGQANGLLTLKHAIKSAYARNAVWALNRTTLGSVRKLKDGQNNYIWMPGIQNGAPNTIDGDPYVEVPDMPSEAAGTFPIAYGDFKRAYVLLDRVAMQLIRDQLTQATSGNVRFIFRRRVGGALVLSEALRVLKCST